jgi:16S rRNA (cytosine967-C5)-methyltransferase
LALELQSRFEQKPASFSDSELMARAVPEWTSRHTSLTPLWARTLQSKARLWLRTRPELRQELAARLVDCHIPQAPALAGALEYRGEQDLFRMAEFQDGQFELQDISSQAVALICAPQAGETWWDACAGEGGKLLHLSALMANKGLIWASDRAAWRLQRLKMRAARARAFNYRLVPWDGGAKLPTKTKFDGILVDAPCTGLGTWQRKPHARWTTSEKDVEELAEIQEKLLVRAAGALKPGGKLIYAVCTITREETEQLARRFAAAMPGLRPWPFQNPLRSEPALSPQLWLGPEDGGNGMFIAAWKQG